MSRSTLSYPCQFIDNSNSVLTNLTQWWFRLKQFVHEVVELITDVDVPLHFVLSASVYVVVLICILLAFEHTTDAPRIGEDVKLPEEGE